MLKTIKTAELDVGMYVILPSSWLKHSFLKGSFTINTQEDIQRIWMSRNPRSDPGKDGPVCPGNWGSYGYR